MGLSNRGQFMCEAFELFCHHPKKLVLLESNFSFPFVVHFCDQPVNREFNIFQISHAPILSPLLHTSLGHGPPSITRRPMGSQ